MPPTTTPVPVPTPTQIVQLQLPSEILDRLTPVTPNWWLQPLATVLAGAGALIAAIIAYRAATRTIKAADKRADTDRGSAANAINFQVQEANRRANRDRTAANIALKTQVNAQADMQLREHEADRERERQAGQVSAVMQAIEAMSRLAFEASVIDAKVSKPLRKSAVAANTSFLKARADCWVAWERAYLYGVPGWESVREFAQVASLYAEGSKTNDEVGDQLAISREKISEGVKPLL